MRQVARKHKYMSAVKCEYKSNVLDFKLSPCSECCIFFFWLISRRLNFMRRRFGTLSSIFIGGVSRRLKPSMKMELADCSETSAYKIQTPGNHPKERINLPSVFGIFHALDNHGCDCDKTRFLSVYMYYYYYNYKLLSPTCFGPYRPSSW